MKPIAWTDDLWNIFLNDEYCMLDDDMKKDMIPLYTAPRELSNEEIVEVLIDKYEKGHGRYADTNLFYIEFARAILKKASEK